MAVLKCEFKNVRKAADVVNDLKFSLEWKSANFALDCDGLPQVHYTYEGEDGEIKSEFDSLFNLDAICEEFGHGEGFNELFDYVFHMWGQDEKGNWCLGYED